MKLPRADWQGWPGMAELLTVLGARDGETRFVGGAVRDTLMQLPVYDVDFATRLTPEAVMLRLEDVGIKAVPTGLKHGTVTAVIGEGRPIEITTLRRDVATDGRHAEIEYTSDWQEDAARRDFTINALSADPVSGEIVDFFGGLADLEARRVRFIGDPLERIAEDHLRILRFFRFHARFGQGEPDAEGLEAAVARANDLMALSRERIADELLKTLALPDPRATTRLMIERGIFSPVLPEITLEGWAVFDRLVTRVATLGYGPDAVRRLAALLPADADIARAVAARLKLSRAQRTRLATAAARETGDAEHPRALAYRLGMESAADRLLIGDASDGDVAAALECLATDPPPRFPLKGGELIEMGLPAGPIVSNALREIEKSWIAEGFPDKARAREIARAHIEKTY
ncbi:CCA tRNA nucleotidyltransferase [Parasphingopyxis marina]|uniref:CCA tRNA nucleotidyltransferase n=1 Tax=Parasphingopyxis marina TaxID=2761622 RepID=A0A842I3A4_9SPHN|nr:CCA tRNA nucleotidyltransferase [Parasphingopyxis marina]MBC2778444.1 CCA tRNA nucleotidyltransferase [Parasphingopyxis marina]